jgi:hypothetical protein
MGLDFQNFTEERHHEETSAFRLLRSSTGGSDGRRVQ